MSIALKTVADLVSRLRELHRRTQETPLFNPVFQLSLDLSRAIEAGELSLDEGEGLLGELECESIKSRAGRLRTLVAPVTPEANDDALKGDSADFAAFRERWENPALHAVFTAHPTFLLPPAQTDAVAQAASSDAPISDAPCAASTERTSRSPAITRA